MVARVVLGQDSYHFLQDQGELDVAFCVVSTLNVLAAAAASADMSTNELEIASTFEKLEVDKAKRPHLLIPRNYGFALRGRVALEKSRTTDHSVTRRIPTMLSFNN